MPATTMALPVTGVVSASGAVGSVLVLEHRLEGHDTFLTGRLDLQDGRSVNVRILTFDDVTVLSVVDGVAGIAPGGAWSGVLHLPHGWRVSPAPQDLVLAAQAADRDLGALDRAELRYAVTFLGEATTSTIRAARIRVIVDALPWRARTTP